MSANYCFVGVFNETTWPSWTEDPPNPIYSRSKAQAVATSVYFLVSSGRSGIFLGLRPARKLWTARGCTEWHGCFFF